MTLEKLLKKSLVLIPTLVLAELRSFLERNSLDVSIVDTTAENGFVIPLEREIAINAGSLHARAREKNKNVSLTDCITVETAKKCNA
ncbi:PIN domain-containing protein [Thermococcus sp.]|uniref:PIN domain-containing protein n=1 Tax=Thermococcus sp. TaxID=35749 RepID=UPI0026329B42|nr:PIN domain-containing protein [Thermococcus sp.]